MSRTAVLLSGLIVQETAMAACGLVSPTRSLINSLHPTVH